MLSIKYHPRPSRKELALPAGCACLVVVWTVASSSRPRLALAAKVSVHAVVCLMCRVLRFVPCLTGFGRVSMSVWFANAPYSRAHCTRRGVRCWYSKRCCASTHLRFACGRSTSSATSLASVCTASAMTNHRVGWNSWPWCGSCGSSLASAKRAGGVVRVLTGIVRCMSWHTFKFK